MFTLLTGPGYDSDGDLSWGAQWDTVSESDWTDGKPGPEDGDAQSRLRVFVWFWDSPVGDQRPCPSTNSTFNIFKPW